MIKLSFLKNITIITLTLLMLVGVIVGIVPMAVCVVSYATFIVYLVGVIHHNQKYLDHDIASFHHDIKVPLLVMRDTIDVVILTNPPNMNEWLLVDSYLNIVMDNVNVGGCDNYNNSNKTNLYSIISDTVHLTSESSKFRHVVITYRVKDMSNYYAFDFSDLEVRNMINCLLDNSVEANATCITITGSVRNDILSLAFEDNGCGILDVNKVFNPNYTTKNGGVRGNGLYYLKTKLNSEGGEVWVSNTSRKGTVINLDLHVNEGV